MQVDEGIVAGEEDDTVDDTAAAEAPHEGTEGEAAAEDTTEVMEGGS